jgi:hypothetical protein
MGGGAGSSGGAEAITCGNYFTALQSALSEDDGAALCHGLAALEAAPVRLEQIERVDIQLLKHGHFYHPSRLVVTLGGKVRHLALNAALTPDGIALLPREVAALDALAEQAGFAGVPRVLAKGSCMLAGNRRGQWFLAPWFDDYHEFHLTRRGDACPSREADRLSVSVWDAAATPLLLTGAQTDALLEGAAGVLTTAVNPHTLAHIFPWHHAAGDFVVRLDDLGTPHVRLITVRDYPPLLPPPEAGQGGSDSDSEAALERLLYALLLLVVQASLRLRVDRLDGVGEIVLYPVSVLAPICKGLLDGLVRMTARWRLPAELDEVVADYLRSLPLARLRDLNDAIQGGFAVGSPERGALAPHLERHARALHHQLQTR